MVYVFYPTICDISVRGGEELEAFIEIFQVFFGGSATKHKYGNTFGLMGIGKSREEDTGDYFASGKDRSNVTDSQKRFVLTELENSFFGT